MTGDSTGRGPRFQAAFWILVLAWRIWAVPVSRLWRDWPVLLALYAIYSAFGSKSRAWPAVTAATMAFLLGIYAHGQLPCAWELFKAAP